VTPVLALSHDRPDQPAPGSAANWA
jgi:hypothetical protein